MKKKITHWLGVIGVKNLIAIGALLVLVVAIAIGIVVSNNNKDKQIQESETEESTGLQVEENADDVEGDSVDFSEFLTEEEKGQDSSKNQQGSNKTDKDEEGSDGLVIGEDADSNDSGTSNGSGVSGGSDKLEEEDNKKDDKEDNKNNNTSGGEFGAFF